MVKSLVDIPASQISLENLMKRFGTPALIIATLIILAILPMIAESANKWASDTEKFWGFVSTAFTVIGGTVGLWFVWLRFIRKRDFAPKLDITLTAGKVFLSSSYGNLHWCGVRMENKGTVSVDYEVTVVPLMHRAGSSTPNPGDGLPPVGRTSSGSHSNVGNGAKKKALITKVDVGASAYEHFVTSIPLLTAQAVTFQVSVTQGDYTWRGCITQSNLQEPPK